jgi:hypothetical protein
MYLARSSPLIKPVSFHLSTTYIINFASVVLIYLGIYNSGKADEKLLRNRDKRVVSYLYYNLILTRSRIKTEEVLHGSKIGYLYVFGQNPLPYGGFVGNEKTFLEGVLFNR